MFSEVVLGIKSLTNGERPTIYSDTNYLTLSNSTFEWKLGLIHVIHN